MDFLRRTLVPAVLLVLFPRPAALDVLLWLTLRGVVPVRAESPSCPAEEGREDM